MTDYLCWGQTGRVEVQSLVVFPDWRREVYDASDPPAQLCVKVSR